MQISHYTATMYPSHGKGHHGHGHKKHSGSSSSSSSSSGSGDEAKKAWKREQKKQKKLMKHVSSLLSVFSASILCWSNIMMRQTFKVLCTVLSAVNLGCVCSQGEGSLDWNPYAVCSPTFITYLDDSVFIWFKSPLCVCIVGGVLRSIFYRVSGTEY